MRLIFDKNPITILFCLIWAVITFFFIIFDVNSLIRIILIIPIIIFIPGHLLICTLFPTKKTEKGIDFVERIALSLGLSLAIVPFFGIILNYTPWGFELQPIILSLELFILIMGSTAIIRWYQTSPSKRFTINISLPMHENRLDKTLTVILIMTVSIALILVVYAATTPRKIEKFTEFYYTTSDDMENKYPQNLKVGENASIILGIANHEYRTINYTIEVWLVNQTIIYNQTLNKNETLYNNLWFMDKINVTLEHKPINLIEKWEPQWEYNYIFNINRIGDFKLVFLLYIYTNSTPSYSVDTDYKDIAYQKINNDITTAYRNIHLNLKLV